MSLFSKLFGSTKKDTTYTGQKPYGSLLDAAGGQDYYNTIKSRMGGQNVGYSPDYVDKASNPVIARMRNQFSSYDLPELKSELTATGRRAGSSGFQQLAKAYENQGLNEEAAYAPIYQQAEEAKRQDINTATGQVGAFNTGDYNARNILSNFEYQNNKDQVAQEQARTAKEAQGYQQLGQAGVQLLLGQPPTSLIPQSSSTPVYGSTQNYGNPNLGFGKSDLSYNDRIAQRIKMAQRGRV